MCACAKLWTWHYVCPTTHEPQCRRLFAFAFPSVVSLLAILYFIPYFSYSRFYSWFLLPFILFFILVILDFILDFCYPLFYSLFLSLFYLFFSLYLSSLFSLPFSLSHLSPFLSLPFLSLRFFSFFFFSFSSFLRWLPRSVARSASNPSICIVHATFDTSISDAVPALVFCHPSPAMQSNPTRAIETFQNKQQRELASSSRTPMEACEWFISANRHLLYASLWVSGNRACGIHAHSSLSDSLKLSFAMWLCSFRHFAVSPLCQPVAS